jgi:hypothetical protein
MDDETKNLMEDFENELEVSNEAIVEESEEPKIEPTELKVDWKGKYDELDVKYKKLAATKLKVDDQMAKMIAMCDYMGAAVEKLGMHLTFDEIHQLF